MVSQTVSNDFSIFAGGEFLMNKAFKYRLYPDEAQKVLIAKTFGCCRFVYNKMLEDRQKYYEETKKTHQNTPAKYKTEFAWLKEVDSLSLCNEQLNLQKAYKNFFEHPDIFGFPQFKSKKADTKSYTTNCINNSIRIVSQNHIQLPKLGIVRFIEHRRIPKDYIIKSVTISKKGSGRYYISILTKYDYDIPSKVLDKEKSIGLDYSTPEFYVDSQGRKPEGYKHLYRISEPKLAREQRKLSKMIPHSANYEKQNNKVARLLEKIANQRKDFIEKLSFNLSQEYDVVCVEDINLQNQAQSLKLGKSTNDNRFGMFRTRLQQKLEIQGKKFIKIDKWTPTSTVCSCCGAYHKDIVNSLSIREWTCPDCGTTHNRDENAAKNILNQGLLLLQ